jgi:hypothetical protein
MNPTFIVEIIAKLRHLAALDIAKAVKLVTNLLVTYSKVVSVLAAIFEFVFEYLTGQPAKEPQTVAA